MDHDLSLAVAGLYVYSCYSSALAPRSRAEWKGTLWGMDPSARSRESQAEADAFKSRLEEAELAIRDHPGKKASRAWDSVTRSYDIWIRNAGELLVLLRLRESGDQQALALFVGAGPRDVSDAFYKVLDQRLHNMIAAAISLVDHTRILVRRYDGEPFEAEFAQRSALVRDEPRTKFLRDLRNYLLHAGHAPLQTRFEVKEDGVMDAKVLLGTDELLAGHEWSSAARKFIRANPPGVHLTREVERYAKDVEQLYRWVFDQFELLHKADIHAVNQLISERNLALSKGAFTCKLDFDAHIAAMIAMGYHKQPDEPKD